MKKLYSSIMLLAIMVAALSLTACGGDDDENGVDGDGSSSTTLKDLKGNWTTVSCSYIPESFDDSSLANVSFLIDYDGIYHFWSSKLGYGTIKSMTDLEKYIKILSYKQTEIKVQVPKYSNAELVMKKFGIKEVVATGIGTALFIVLTEVQIPLGIIPNTSM